MPSAENDPYLAARRELARRAAPVPPSTRKAQQGRVIELMRRRARGSSLAALYNRLQELERENDRLRHGPHGGPA